MNRILLGVDLEEFDIPEEYGQKISEEKKIQVSKEGLAVLEVLFARHAVQSTLFTTAFWASAEPEKIRLLADDHEIASHSFHHNHFNPGDLLRSKETLSQISGKEINGFRMPRLEPVTMKSIAEAGYRYDSSLHPTWLPGRYNNLGKKRKIFKDSGIYEMPVSVSPYYRIPVFWLAFKVMPISYYLYLCKRILKNDGYLILYFHPWEFTDLSEYALPWYIRRFSGKQMAVKMDRLLSSLSSMGSFCTHSQLLESL